MKILTTTLPKHGRFQPHLARALGIAILLCSLILVCSTGAQESGRKVTARTAPSYPELARRMHLTGKVKLEVVVTAAGSVSSAKLVGGNPVFERSAIDAVKQWKFEAAPKETKSLVVLEFADQ
jgi:TonB family protein